MEKCSVFADCRQEADRFKWIESERLGCDQGQDALRRWFQQHWNGYLRARWLEHIEGTRFWEELDRGDFGIIKHRFAEKALLLDRILDRLKLGQENLNVINWAIEWCIPMPEVLEILEVLDINSRRLSYRFDC